MTSDKTSPSTIKSTQLIYTDYGYSSYEQHASSEPDILFSTEIVSDRLSNVICNNIENDRNCLHNQPSLDFEEPTTFNFRHKYINKYGGSSLENYHYNSIVPSVNSYECYIGNLSEEYFSTHQSLDIDEDLRSLNSIVSFEVNKLFIPKKLPSVEQEIILCDNYIDDDSLTSGNNFNTVKLIVGHKGVYFNKWIIFQGLCK